MVATGIQTATAAVREPLECLGFRKRAGAIFTIDLGNEVLGWLGLNHATRYTRAGEAEVNPIVGVRHQGVERLTAELRGEKFDAYRPPTVSTPIGYVMPDHRYTAWMFGPGDNRESTAELVAAVADYGLPFMRSLVELPALHQAIENGLSNFREYRLPVVLALLEDSEQAVAVMRHIVDALGERHDQAAEQLRHFSAEFQRSHSSLT